MCVNPPLIFALCNPASKLYTDFTHFIPYPFKLKYKWENSIHIHHKVFLNMQMFYILTFAAIFFG